jgi:hypothetical protein
MVIFTSSSIEELSRGAAYAIAARKTQLRYYE